MTLSTPFQNRYRGIIWDFFNMQLLDETETQTTYTIEGSIDGKKYSGIAVYEDSEFQGIERIILNSNSCYVIGDGLI